MPNISEALSELGKFEPTHWASWIDAFVQDTPVPPELSRGQDPPHLALNAIYDQLSVPARNAFASGLTELLPTGVQPSGQYADLARIYCLLQVAAHVGPRNAKPLLMSRLTSESLRGFSYGGWDLHSLLLVACSQFGVDESLSTYIFDSVESIKDFDYVMFCFRMLIKPGPSITPFLLLEPMLTHLNEAGCSERIAQVLDEAVWRKNGWYLLCWLQDSAPGARQRNPAGVDALEKLLRDVVPWPDTASAQPSTLLLAGWVHAPYRHFTASDLKCLLETVRRLLPELQPDYRVGLALQRLRDYGQQWKIRDGRDPRDSRNRLLGFSDYIFITTKDENGKETEEKLLKANSEREQKILDAIVDSRPARQQSKVASEAERLGCFM